ncbi:hypothetical protein OPV22_028639 [Ensete ventricosum]|uniref:Uncharacterized protein n=1 Tax=Ensete ventricosum TaxID=4639 RepID=A0AAV8PYX6_ENSVE|nr:hypothetical protein OPV22_028639 [Ensete ventricosum]
MLMQMPAHCGPLLGFPVLFVIKHLSLSIAPSISSVFVALWAGLDEDDGGVWLCGLRNGSGRGERGVWALNGKAMRLYCSERRGGRPPSGAERWRLGYSFCLFFCELLLSTRFAGRLCVFFDFSTSFESASRPYRSASRLLLAALALKEGSLASVG